jgi:ribose-phosphate pyrophosphokinase
MVLNLDLQFNPFPLETTILFESFTFSGGEPHIKIKTDLSETREVTISHRIQSFNDLGLILIAVDALRNLDVEKINLFIPYFPAARQDRLMVNGEALTVKVYAELINNLHLNHVTVFDPHSEVTPALLNRCKVIDNYEFIEKVTQEINNDLILISPDGGALKKIHKVAKYLQKYPVVECSKTRDVKTGKLSGFKVYADNLQGKDCLIVDDICDGGNTFLGLAEELRAKNAGKLYIAVSHGIFSKGFEGLNQYFETIFTTDSFNELTLQNKLTIIPLASLKK